MAELESMCEKEKRLELVSDREEDCKCENNWRKVKCFQCDKYFREYCDNTTIHGLKYVGERRSYCELFCWILIISVCFGYCYVISMRTYVKWQKSPILIGFKQNPVPVWQIPFPAVTVCPQTKSKATVRNYTAMYNSFKKGESLTYEEMSDMQILSMVCLNQLTTAESLFFGVDEDALDILAAVAPTLADMKTNCGWRQNNTQRCSSLMTPVFTVEGLCYTFNSLDRKDMYTEAVSHYENFGQINRSIKGWDYERGYDNRLGIRTYPRRDLHLSRKHVEQSGFLMRAGLHENDLDDVLCSGTATGFKVFLHHPAETVKHGQQFFTVPLNQIAEIIVEPRMMTTDEGLRSYEPSVRRCYYQGEKPLAFYRTYTKRNCEMECLANMTYEHANCTAYYMPRRKDWKICGPGLVELANLFKDIHVAFEEAFNFDYDYKDMKKLMARDIVQGIKKLGNETDGDEDDEKWEEELANDDEITDDEIEKIHCNCLPSCESDDYFARKVLKDYEWEDEFAIEGVEKDMSQFEGMHFSRIMVIYMDNKVQAAERTELFGTEDFIANIGGLLGLFTGFSFLSGFEILYYLTLRIWCKYYRGRRKRNRNSTTTANNRNNYR